MDQSWFEMDEVRKRTLQRAVWIPIRASQKILEIGKFGSAGFQEEFFGSGSAIFPIEAKPEVINTVGWMEVGISRDQRVWVSEGIYYPARDFQEFNGEFLVLAQHFNSVDLNEWHLSEDLVIALGLKREGDSWVRPAEGYIEVARLWRSDEGDPALLEIRSSHICDYLSARKMGLYVTSYRSRSGVLESDGGINWPAGNAQVKRAGVEWEGRVMPIHEGGMRFGEEIAIFHMGRTDVDPEDDAPSLGFPTDENVQTSTSTRKFEGRKLFHIMGEVWMNEWIDPTTASPIVANDEVPSTVFFITDAQGAQENKDSLIHGEGRWLWFRPDVVTNLLTYRGSSLIWHTRDTGGLSCSPNGGVHFGVNSLGLVNVYAKDIGLLPPWQQKIWSGFNVPPEGKVSRELLASQVEAEPARTQAPEAFLAKGLEALSELSKTLYGTSFVREHEKTPEILQKIHRFRATDLNGLFALAKDLARVTADCLDLRLCKRW